MSVDIKLVDGALAIAPEETDQVVVVMGASSKGAFNTLTQFTNASITSVKENIGRGKGPNAVAHVMNTPGHGPVIFIPLDGTPGTNGAVTAPKSSSPAVTVTGNPLDDLDGKIEILSGGALGTATFQWSVDDGRTWHGPFTTAASFVLPDIGLHYTAVTATGTTPPTLTLTGTAKYEFDLRVECTTAGALGVWVLRYSLDGGKTWTSGVTSAATIALGTTGVTLNIATGNAATDNVWTAKTQGMVIGFAAGTYVAGDVYTWASTAPTHSNTQVTDAFTALQSSGSDFGWTYVAVAHGGVSDNVRATACASLFSALTTKLDALETSGYKFVGCTIEAPSPLDPKTTSGLSTWRTELKTAFANLSHSRLMVAAGYGRLPSDLDSRIYRRPIAFAVAARIGSTPVGEHLGRVATGNARGWITIEHDENDVGGLDAARFTTMCRVAGLTGFYIKAGKQMAAAGSDYLRTQNLRVINLAAKILRNALLRYLNEDFIVDQSTGRIREDEAKAIDEETTAALREALEQTRQASSVEARVSRLDNIISTGTLSGEAKVQPKGYAEKITYTLGMTRTIAAVTA